MITARALPPRLVVADLSAVQAHSGRYRVPDGVGLVLPRIYLAEVVGKLSTEPERKARGHIGRFHDLLVENRGRVFIGRNMGELSHAEHHPDLRIQPKHIIDFETQPYLMTVRGTRDQVVDRIVDGALLLESELDARLALDFARSRAFWRERGDLLNVDPKDKSRFRSTRRHRLDWAHHPARVATCGESAPKFQQGAWRRSLDVFPDRYSWPRWIRLVDWYGLAGFLNPDWTEEEFRNDHTDAQYAHLASHVGEIAVADSRLAEAVEVLFPKVIVRRVLP